MNNHKVLLSMVSAFLFGACSGDVSLGGKGVTSGGVAATGGQSSQGGVATETGGAKSGGGAVAATGGKNIGPRCGSATCGADEYCCNESCDLCAPINGGSCNQVIVCDGNGGAGSTGGAASTGGNAAATGGTSAGAQCGSTVCGANEYCCNPSCSICSPINGGGCIAMVCGTGGSSSTGGAPATGGKSAATGGTSAGTQCGSTVCGADEYCCNPSCSICSKINGGGCIEMVCSGTGGSSSTGGAAGTGGASSIAGLHNACVNGACSSSLLTPVTYYGVAGTAGPLFCSCEIPCRTTACPSNMKCGSIGDGPSDICMYTNASGYPVWP